ncbi:MAG: KH domain-containing protein [Acidimicrobiia bacterium]
MTEDEYDSSDEFDDEVDDEDDLDLVDEDEDEDDDLDDDDLPDDDLPDEVGAEGNRLVGGLPKGVLEYLARNIVDDPDAVFVETSEGRGEVELRLHVAPGDMGKVIGRRGRVAQALRQVVAAAGSREGVRASLDIVD